MKFLAFALAALTLSCTTTSGLAVMQPENAALERAGPYFVEFEFDRVDLAGIIRASLAEHGFGVTDSQAQARYVWTGAYSCTLDFSHQRFDWAQFKIVDQKSGATVCKFITGQTGYNGVGSIVDRMVVKLLPESERSKAGTPSTR